MADPAPNSVVITAEDGSQHVFPPGFDPIKAAGIVRQQNAAPPSATTPADGDTALKAALAAHLTPLIQRGLEEAATNPRLKPLLAAAGQLAGGATQLPDPLRVAAGMWAGGKAGWRSAYFVQKLATPLAAFVDHIAPYVKAATTTVNPLIGAQGLNDLTQMAEPSRQDIGILGIGKSVSDAELMDGLVKKGMPAAMAAHAIAKGNADTMSLLMKPYQTR